MSIELRRDQSFGDRVRAGVGLSRRTEVRVFVPSYVRTATAKVVFEEVCALVGPDLFRQGPVIDGVSDTLRNVNVFALSGTARRFGQHQATFALRTLAAEAVTVVLTFEDALDDLDALRAAVREALGPDVDPRTLHRPRSAPADAEPGDSAPGGYI